MTARSFILALLIAMFVQPVRGAKQTSVEIILKVHKNLQFPAVSNGRCLRRFERVQETTCVQYRQH